MWFSAFYDKLKVQTAQYHADSFQTWTLPLIFLFAEFDKIAHKIHLIE